MKEERSKTRSEEIEAMLIRLDKERPIDVSEMVRWNDMKKKLDDLHDPISLGSALDEYFGNEPWIPHFEGTGDPSIPSTWVGVAETPKTFAETYGADPAPVQPLPPPAPAPSVQFTGELLVRAVSLLTQAAPLIRSWSASNPTLQGLADETEDFLKGIK